jgi:hypothetical protein
MMNKDSIDMYSVRFLIRVSTVVLLAVGCGRIWGAGSSADRVVITVQPPRFEIANGRVRIWFQAEQGTWSMAARDGSAEISGSVVAVRLGDKQILSSEPCRRTVRRLQGHDDAGDYLQLEVVHAGLPHLTELVWSATLRPGQSYAVFRASVRIASEPPGPLQSLELISSAQKPLLRFGTAPAGWMCFRDSGHQGGTGVVPFFVNDRARQSSPATLVIHDDRAGQSFLLGWLSWAGSNPSLLLGGSRSEGLREASAGCSYFTRGMLPAAAAEPLLVGFEPDPLVALEQYAQEVRLVNKVPLRKDNLLGWLSWYCSRLRMTEQFVLNNAQVIAQRFRDYGIDTMQVDHGWEYRDVVGHWVANQRFPHGMKWLAQELEKFRMKLGIWMAVSQVSEFAPFYGEHPEAMIHKPDGSPWAFTERWTWAPHGRVFNLDPSHPLAQEHYRKSLQGLMDAGCRYYKVDFIGSAGVTQALFHDPQRPRGNPMLRYEMQQIRDAIRPDSWLRYCSSPSNVYCGIVNIGGATMDIGNAAGNWKHLEKYHQQLGTCWYKHRTFWSGCRCAAPVSGSRNGLGGAVPGRRQHLAWWSPQRQIVKWLPLHFRANAGRKYSFVPGRQVRSPIGPPILVQEGGANVVATGPLAGGIA